MPTGGSTEAGFGTGIWVSSYADRGRRGFCSPTGVRSTTLRQTLIAGCIVGVLGSELGCSGGKIASPAADSEFSSHAPDAGRQLEDGSSSPQPEEDARVVDGEVAPPPDATQDMDSSVPETGLDPFGVRMLRSTKASGQTWFAAWQGNARTLNPGEYDPIDDTFRMRGGGHTLTIPGDGTAHATGTTQRYYIQDPAGVKRWGRHRVHLLRDAHLRTERAVLRGLHHRDSHGRRAHERPPLAPASAAHMRWRFTTTAA
jgi:hypothetical protein